MASSPRRVGAATSKTREALLDCVQKMMLEDGYASVSYRALATKAGVTPSLVQYYFPTLDGIFLAAIERYSERNLKHLANALREREDDPLHAVWEYSWDEATGTLMTEFMALANHRKSIRAAIADVTERVREVQLEAVAAAFGTGAGPDGRLSASAALLLVSGLPKLLNLEEGIGVDTAHTELVEVAERYLDSVEPPKKPAKRSPTARNCR